MHWELSAVDGTVEISWAMVDDKPWGEDGDLDVTAELPDKYLAPDEYFPLADSFDPGQWDPYKWLAAAKRAGMDYAVMTTKHHDGFALWPSAYGEFNTAEYLNGRDLVGEFVDACPRHGLKVGLYFSLPDWHHPDFPRPETLAEIRASNPEGMGVESYDRRTESGTAVAEPVDRPRLMEPNELIRFERYFRYVKGQLRELLTGYGDIDLLWFDLPVWAETLNHRMESLYHFVRSTQQGIVINGRTHVYDELGDFHTPENVLPTDPLDGLWKLCQVWAPPAWAYTETEEYRDLDWTLERLAKTVARGGNLELSVAPKPDGELPDQAYERLGELADWMAHSKPAVTGVERGPWPPRAEVPVTRRNGVWYVHVLRDHEGGVTVSDVPRPSGVRLLRTGEPLVFDYDENDATVEFAVDPDRRASGNEVVAISFPPDRQHLL